MGFHPAAGTGGATAFTDLTDTPSSYTGEATKYVRVNAGESALEFVVESDSAALTSYDDTASEYGTKLNSTVNDVQELGDAADTRLDFIEGEDADTLAGVALTQSVAGVLGRMSNGAPNNFNTLVAGNTYTNLVNTLSFTLAIPTGDAAQKGDKGSLVAVLNGVQQTDSFDLAGAFSSAERDGSQTYPPSSSAAGTITITSVQKFGNTSLYQIVKGRINLNGTFDAPGVLSGENSILLRHVLSTGNQNSSTVIFF